MSPAEAPPDTRERWSRSELSILLAITLLGVSLRMWHLEQWPLSATETTTWRGATESLWGNRGFLSSPRAHQPLGPLMLRWLLDLGVLRSPYEGWLRLPFAGIGLLTVPLLALAARRVVGRRAALLAAGLLAIHPWHIAASQTASSDVIALALMVGAAGVLLKARDERSAWLVAGVAGLLLLTALCLGADWLALPLIWLCAAFAQNRRGFRLVMIYGAGIVGVFLVLAAFPSAPHEVVGPAAGESMTKMRYATIVLGVIGHLLWRAPWGNRAPAVERAWLLLAAVVPGFTAVFLAVLGRSTAEGIALLALPAVLCLAAVGVFRIMAIAKPATTAMRRRSTVAASWLVMVAIALDLAVDSYLYTTVDAGRREAWRSARDAVLRETGRSPKFTAFAAAGFPSLVYYLRPGHWRDPTVDPHPGRELVRVASHATQRSKEQPTVDSWASAVQSAVDATGEAVFLVLDGREWRELERDAAIQAVLRQSFEIVEVVQSAFDPGNRTIYVVRRRAADGG